MSGPYPRFDHVVVLMLENRSFDNMLGYLYAPDEVPRGQHFEGVIGKGLSNPVPPGVEGPERIPVYRNPGTFESMQWPKPDPGEPYPQVNVQLFDLFNPKGNRFQPITSMSSPYNTPVEDYRCQGEPPPRMQGFVNDYISNFVSLSKSGERPTPEQYELIMSCFTPSAETGVPVISTLAKSFAVCDHWHCAVPSQTFCNRSFFNSASSSGYVVNGIDLPDYAKWPLHNTQETIFNRLASRGHDWRIYFDAEDVFSLTLLIHFERLKDDIESRFCHMKQFFRDVRRGKLPAYSFVEPRLFFNHNDEHPPVDIPGSDHSSVLAGEILIQEVYDAIRRSDSPTGSNAENTLLVITYDEHGGCYDHVAPPCATPPEAGAPAGEMGFRFDRLGIRIPTVLISAYVEEGTVVETPLQHTSMIRTMSEKWNLGTLTDRDASAPPIPEGLFTDAVRPGSTWPEVEARPYKRKLEHNRHHPLNDLQNGILRTVAGYFEEHGVIDEQEIDTVGKAVKYLKRKLKSL